MGEGTTSAFPREEFAIVVFVFLLAWAATAWASPPAALLVGVLFALVLGNPIAKTTGAVNKKLLKLSVVALGFGIPLGVVASAGQSGILQITVAVVCVTLLGLGVGRFLGVEWTTSWLITIGTAICGGSAIAALGPTIRARAESMSVALGTVFILNAIALYAFPPIGTWAGLGQVQFGQWAAIAIHDTASVVGAAATYGPKALETATVLKLVRTLWIVPLVALASIWMSARVDDQKTPWTSRAAMAFPWFVVGFLAAAAFRTLLPSHADVFDALRGLGRQGLVVTLFLIGAGLTVENLKKVGPRPLVQGVVLWVVVSATSLALIRFGFGF